MPETVTLDQVIDYLNSLAALDPGAVRNLITTRVLCNEALTNHPTLQVIDHVRHGRETSVLALINGLFALTSDGRGQITAITSANGIYLFGFQRTDQLAPDSEK